MSYSTGPTTQATMMMRRLRRQHQQHCDIVDLHPPWIRFCGYTIDVSRALHYAKKPLPPSWLLPALTPHLRQLVGIEVLFHARSYSKSSAKFNLAANLHDIGVRIIYDVTCLYSAAKMAASRRCYR